MGSENRLRARLRPSTAESIGAVADDRGIADAEAERLVVREGLEAMGYLERPKEAGELFVWYLHQIGLVLGFSGLIMIGYGVFGSRLFSLIGFGLLVAGFLFIAMGEGINSFGGVEKESAVDEHAKSA